LGRGREKKLGRKAGEEREVRRKNRVGDDRN